MPDKSYDSDALRHYCHRLYQRHDISRLPRETGPKAKGQTFRATPIGYLHLDICDVHTGEGRAYLFVAVDRTSKFVHARLYQKANRDQSTAFLEDVVQQVPYQVHMVLTDNGAQLAKRRGTETCKPHRFDVICREHGIEHRLTRPFHPWNNNQWSGQTDEPNPEGRHDPQLSLRHAGRAGYASEGLSLGL
nr:DDE-type integrase/transposase/recombinase [Kushneria avicenniae]